MSSDSTPPAATRRGRPGGSGPRRRRKPAPKPAPVAHTEPPTLAYEPEAFDPSPIAFSTLSLDARLLSGIGDLGWSETRSVQSGVIPLALAGHDVIACAETGTGKTAAFLVPILQRFLREGPTREPATRALILAPTRELAVQIGRSFDTYLADAGMNFRLGRGRLRGALQAAGTGRPHPDQSGLGGGCPR